jgi:signal transduction histidine kinase
MINTNIQPVDATVNTLVIQLTCLSVLMIFLAILLSLLISKKIAKPIEKMNKAAKILATGNYDVKFNDDKNDGYKEITELGNSLNYAASELSKVEKLRRELIANVSHDLRTPLTLIKGYSEAMRDLPGENTPENVQVIIDETQRLTSLVNDTLDLSKLQSGTQTLNLSRFSITDLINSLFKRYTKFTETDGYKFNFIYDCNIEVMADELKISQVIYNLINNALTYTGADKTITVKQTLINDEVKIEVIDTGEGISKENIPFIWDRYYKVDKVHKRAAIGTGLGLAIVKSLIDLQKGAKIGIESEIGKGSDFWFILPIY